MALLVPAEGREAYAARVQALVARNAALSIINSQLAEAEMSKATLARKAGLNESAVRRLLTAETANPTSDNIFRLMSALGIKLEAVTPSGERLALV
jgi:DNA-binding phage protein